MFIIGAPWRVAEKEELLIGQTGVSEFRGQ